MENIDTEKITKKWLPIIEKLGGDLSTIEQIELCLYADSYTSLPSYINNNLEYDTNILPMLLNIFKKLIPKLRENNLSLHFISDSRLNREIIFKNDCIKYIKFHWFIFS